MAAENHIGAREQLEHLGYRVAGEAGGPYAVRGFGVGTMVATDAELELLADLGAHAERRFQYEQPTASAARTALERAGYVVRRIDPAGDAFELEGGPSWLDPADLVRIADEHPRVAFTAPREDDPAV